MRLGEKNFRIIFSFSSIEASLSETSGGRFFHLNTDALSFKMLLYKAPLLGGGGGLRPASVLEHMTCLWNMPAAVPLPNGLLALLHLTHPQVAFDQCHEEILCS